MDSDVLEKLRQINQHIEESPYHNQPIEKAPPMERPNSIFFVLMILLSIFFGFIGLVVGIFYMISTNKEYQFMGIVMTIIGSFFTLLGSIFLLVFMAVIMY